MTTYYVNVTLPSYQPVRISQDPGITNGNIMGDSSIEFTADGFEPGDTAWIGGWTGFDDSDLRAFKTKESALMYSLSKAVDCDIDTELETIQINLLTEGSYVYGKDTQDYSDLVLMQVKIPDDDQ